MAQRVAQAELDDLIVYMELTLIAIVQGIALFLLVEGTAEIIDNKAYQFAPFVVSGLVVVVLFWFLSLAHTFTVVGWPLDMGHNALYFLAAFLQSLLYTEISHPRSWWVLFTACAVCAWVLFAYDLRLFRQREAVRADEAHREMLAAALREQRLQVRLIMPAAVCATAGGTACVWLWPESLAVHFTLAAAQAAGLLAYLVRIGWYLARIAPLVARARESRV